MNVYVIKLCLKQIKRKTSENSLSQKSVIGLVYVCVCVPFCFIVGCFFFFSENTEIVRMECESWHKLSPTLYFAWNCVIHAFHSIRMPFIIRIVNFNPYKSFGDNWYSPVIQGIYYIILLVYPKYLHIFKLIWLSSGERERVRYLLSSKFLSNTKFIAYNLNI